MVKKVLSYCPIYSSSDFLSLVTEKICVAPLTENRIFTTEFKENIFENTGSYWYPNILFIPVIQVIKF